MPLSFTPKSVRTNGSGICTLEDENVLVILVALVEVAQTNTIEYVMPEAGYVFRSCRGDRYSDARQLICPGSRREIENPVKQARFQ